MASVRVISSAVRSVAGKKVIPRRAPLTLTVAAVSRIKDLMKEQTNPQMALKVGMKTKGCNGLSYTLEYAEKKGKFDEEVQIDGLKIYIDSKAQLTLLGTEMDYIEDKLHSGFVFNNPNIKGTCGCGESFSL